jgi:hypothetical protein
MQHCGFHRLALACGSGRRAAWCACPPGALRKALKGAILLADSRRIKSVHVVTERRETRQSPRYNCVDYVDCMVGKGITAKATRMPIGVVRETHYFPQANLFRRVPRSYFRLIFAAPRIAASRAS